MYIDLFKLKAYKLFENSDADLSWPGVEINFFSYSQKIASAMISNLLNASCFSQNDKYDFLLYYCQYH